jgi:hypothetical protein
MGMPSHPGYARALAGLRQGLDGVLSDASTRPVGQVARGFIIELLARASWVEQRWAAAEQRPATMGCHGALQLMRWLKVAGTQVGVLAVWGGDGLSARHRQFDRCCHAGEQRRGRFGGREG